ncbi:MAG: energy-coupling factor transport system ATP-binding protein [Actinomycetota bacterium]|jgi:energy-coupling factor transport system ATP-binding protein|nr:energy-coupling factor transport system ATP-binding protein [Actinomycetota bacterium]
MNDSRAAAGDLRYDAVGFTYPEGPVALSGVELEVAAGEVVLVVGESGSGKSTLLRCANGLVPHSSGGRFAGSVHVGGRSTRTHRPRELADLVGFVHQDPEAQFVVDHVETDLAFVLENLGTDARSMRRRVEEVLDALAIAHLRDRSPATLSGGERQRCAIAGALAAAPAVLVLDEPTSQLDPQGADDVLAALTRLNADLGTTILLAEHRLERAAPLADRAVLVSGGAIAADDTPAAVLARYDGAPPVTHLGRLLGWEPLPLTVRDARARVDRERSLPALQPIEGPEPGPIVLRARGLGTAIDGHQVLERIDAEVARGEVVALLGRNGSGKTTLLRTLAGLLAPANGKIEHTAGTRVAYVPQDPNSLLFAPTVAEELAATLRLLGRRDPAAIETWLQRLDLVDARDRHPRSLSGGERQRVAIAAVAVGGADVLLLDEPTRGMDAASRNALEAAVGAHAQQGGAVVLATHDVELAARCASRAIVIGDGDIVADGPAREVLSGSLFAPQVLRVLPPFLTVAEVARSLAAATPRARA